MQNLKSAAFAALFVMAGTLGAFAHAKMNASVPKDGETVTAGLSAIQPPFSKPLRLSPTALTEMASPSILGALMKSMVYMNGVVMPAADAKVSVMDR